MNRLKGFLFLLVLSFASCEKDVDTPSWTQNPVFHIQGLLNGNPFQLEAGNDDYYLHTGYYDTASLPREFFGLLNHLDCPECVDQFQIRLRNYSMANSSPATLDSIFHAGEHAFTEPYLPNQQGLYAYRFNAEIDSTFGSVSSVAWDFGDGNTSSELNPVHVYDISSGQTMKTCSLSVSYSTGCQVSSYQIINVGSNCYSSFSEQVSGYESQFTLNQPPTGNRSYSWDFGDGYYSNQAEPDHVYSDSGIYTVILTVSEGGGTCQSFYKRNVLINSNECFTNCGYEPIALQTNNDWSQYRHMAVDYIDDEGQRWSSEYGFQPPESFISLEEPMEPFIINESGMPTYKVNGSVRCILFSPDRSDSIYLDSGQFSWAFAY